MGYNIGKSIIYVENIWADDIFEWVYKTVIDCCGDGCVTIICSNYKEVANWFLEYIRPVVTPCRWELTEYEEYCSVWDNQEGYFFTDVIPATSFDKDYIFVVKYDCVWDYHYRNKFSGPIKAILEVK